MLHFVAKSLDGTPLFRTWAEGRALWLRVTRSTPGLVALVIMPDHIHLLHAQEIGVPLGRALAAYARWRNAARGEKGAVFARSRPPKWVEGGKHLRRTVRYIALNPCRADLVRDPLAWPLSSYRDSVGLAFDPVCPRQSDPRAFHAFVSGDPWASVSGTPWPATQVGPVDAATVAEAVCGLFRVGRSALTKRSRERALFVRAARTLGVQDVRAIAEIASCTVQAVYKAPTGWTGDVQLVQRVLGDPRFHALPEYRLDRIRDWQALGGR